MTLPTQADCTQCGACCATPDGSLACGVSASDKRRLGWVWSWRHLDPSQAPGLVGTIALRWRGYPDGRFAGKRLCHCVALDGRVGEAVTCSVYERRPDNCRALEAGSEGCLKMRRAVGIDEVPGDVPQVPKVR